MSRTPLLFLLVAHVAACTKSQAELDRFDRERLETVIAEDTRVSVLLGSVDKAAQQGDTAVAVGTIDAMVRPALSDEQRALDGVAPKTAWGRAQREEIAGLVADRQAAIGPYREALLSKSPEAQLAVLETQAKIERRALAIVAVLHPAR